ncbi:sugar phosphate isomerase/epimerase [Paenibacillus sp. J2TS4]|uniref:sugar phosphate isomerase/epimerase family protein n=1 Tax=Paenibacillus sp. J2TS4 TaxID=2807194 RepID=UPI001B195F2F|nr:sugar phosphate isomerase/epimerase family protein [Paenibacillus sp. J2TS4]GIP31458.1 xylose isomerase [Paenibacillus sp. J2TS4]
MITLTGFADEISAEFKEQLDCLESEGIRYLEFRGVWNKNVLDLTDEEIAQVKEMLEERGIKISAIGSPIGKIKITDPFEPHVEKFHRALQLAKYFDTRYIRIFSFFMPENEKPEVYRDEVMRRMKELVRLAEEADIILLHENEKEIYGDNTERCLDILTTCRSSHLRAAFDPANFVQCGVKPFDDAYFPLKPHIEYVHIKDALFADGSVTVAGQGDGQVPQVLADLQASNYAGFMSLEPHLQAAGTFQGFSGPALFKEATSGLKKLLSDLNWEWN